MRWESLIHGGGFHDHDAMSQMVVPPSIRFCHTFFSTEDQRWLSTNYKQNEVTGIWGIFRGYTDVRIDALHTGQGTSTVWKMTLENITPGSHWFLYPWSQVSPVSSCPKQHKRSVTCLGRGDVQGVVTGTWQSKLRRSCPFVKSHSGFQKGQGLWQESSATPLDKDPFTAPCAEEAMVERPRRMENRAECPGFSSTHRSQMWECYVMILWNIKVKWIFHEEVIFPRCNNGKFLSRTGV